MGDMKVYLSNKAFKEYKNKKFRYLKKKFKNSLKNINRYETTSKTFTTPTRKNKYSGVILKEYRLINPKFHLDYRVVYGIDKEKNEVYIVDLFKKQRQVENDRIRDDFEELDNMVLFDKHKKELVISRGD